MSLVLWRKLFRFDFFRTAVLLLDALVMLGSMMLAFLLVFDGAIPSAFQMQSLYFSGLALGSTLSLFAALGVYSRRLPHLSEREVRWLVAGALTAECFCFLFESSVHPAFWLYAICFWAVFFVVRGFLGIFAFYRNCLFAGWQLWAIPALCGLTGVVTLKLLGAELPYPMPDLPVSRTVHALYFLLSTAGFVLLRWFLHWVFVWYRGPHLPSPRAVLLGEREELSLFSRLNELSRSYQIVAILDNDPLQWGMRIREARVVGNLSQLESVAVQFGASTVLMLKDSLSSADAHDMEERCRNAGLKLVRLGSVHESLLRADSLSTADLLERKEYRFLPAARDNYLLQKRVLVTGAGGSIGSELVRQVLRCSPQVVILLGRGENSIFELSQELSQRGYAGSVLSHIVNIADNEGLERVFEKYKPQVVFHAAAHKHVPLMETNVCEAVRNNVLGTWNVMDVAGRFQVERVVMISTDKAVAPHSVMGATKRKAEQVVAECARKYSATSFSVVRFGNVLGSRGSVVRIFQEQIRNGGPVTVTDPRMTRYFMTIPEAVSLVLASGGMGNQFAVYVLEMGKPYRIVELAEKMIHLCGLEPGRDIRIEFTGIRPGEKLEEVLVTGDEKLEETSNPGIRRLACSVPTLDGALLSAAMRLRSDSELRKWLFESQS